MGKNGSKEFYKSLFDCYDSLSPGRKIVVSFATKYDVPPQIYNSRDKHHKTTKQLINSSVYSLLAACRFDRTVLFDCRSYCRHSDRRRQANKYLKDVISAM